MKGPWPVLLPAFALCLTAEAAEPQRVAMSQGSGPVSPAVVGTWIVNEAPGASPRLELLVLWRGTPGWFMQGESGEATTGGSTVGRDGAVVAVQQLNYGDVRLGLEFEQKQGVVRLMGQEIPLQSANVVLVDDVDGPNGPSLAGTRHVDPELPESPESSPPIPVILRRSPDLVDFLRCDAKVPDSSVQPMFDALCARLTGP